MAPEGRRRVIVVSAVLLALATMSMRLIVLGEPGPRAADATPVAKSASVPTPAPVRATQPARVDASGLQQWARRPIVPVRRNLFVVSSLENYALPSGANASPGQGNVGFWQGVAKSVSSQADQQNQRQVLVESVRKQAASLKLESTIQGSPESGSQPSAMVNGEMVQEGSVVAGFRVLEIRARRMIVEREGIQLEILMK